MFFFLRGGSQNSKISQFQTFPKLGMRGGSHQISNFSQIQKSPKHPGGGGDQENWGLFPLFVTFFNSEASLRLSISAFFSVPGYYFDKSNKINLIRST